MDIKNKSLVLLIISMVMINLLPMPTLFGVDSADQYNIFVTKTFIVRPLGTFKRYVIGLMSTELGNNTVVAVDMYNGSVIRLAAAESLGLDAASLRFWKTDDYFMLVDNKLAVIWDTNLRQVGRFAHDNLRGVAILPNRDLVAWSDEVVFVAKELGYVFVGQYDVWNATYYYFLEERTKPRDLLAVYGKDPDTLEKEWFKELMDTVRSSQGMLLWHNFTYRYELAALTGVEARQKLLVFVVGASYINGTVYAATKLQVSVRVTLSAEYAVQQGNQTEIRTYEKEEIYPINLGALVKVVNSTATLEELYADIDAAGVSSTIIYVYVPLISTTTAPRMLATILENGSIARVPLYTWSKVLDVHSVGNYILVHTDGNVLYIYKEEGDKNIVLVSSIAAKSLVDYGMLGDGRQYLLYMNYIGGFELGLLDEYSGRYNKYVLETVQQPVGVWLKDDLLFVAVNDGGFASVKVGVQKDLSTVTISVVDSLGNMVHDIVNGSITIRYGELVYREPLHTNPTKLMVPPGSTIEVYAEVPYGRGYSTYAILSAGRYDLKLTVQKTLAPGLAGTGYVQAPFNNPFSKEFVVIRDSDILKYQIPGATSLDVYGSYVAMIESTNSLSTSVLSLYTARGERVFRITLPGLLTDVKIYYPYIVVRGDRIYVVDAVSGSIRLELDMQTSGFVLDLKQDYLSAWNSNTIILVDLRRQTTTYMDMSRYGTVVFAPALNGVVYAYVVRPNKTSNIYVINAATRGVIEVLPWDGVSVLSYASDGIFHAVSFVTRDNRVATDVLSVENGVVRIESSGQVAWVKDLGNVVDVPEASDVVGNRFAAVVLRDLGDAYVYLVGFNYKLLQVLPLRGGSLAGFSLSFVGTVQVIANASPVMVLKDYGGTTRVVMTLSTIPTLFAVSENLIAYGNKDAVYLLPNPKFMGKYQVKVYVYNDVGQPINATIRLEEFNIEVGATNGLFTSYLSAPGTYHLSISAQHYNTEEINVTVNDESPTAVASVYLRPTLYTLTIHVVDLSGREVHTGVVSIRGVDIAYNASFDLSKESPVASVRVGTYTISFTSDLYRPAQATVFVDGDRTVSLATNRTAVRVVIRVVDESSNPLPGARVSISSAAASTTLNTNGSGVVVVVLPYRQLFNLSVTYPGYTGYRRSFNATEELEVNPITVTLRKISGLLTIILQDEEGKPETGTVLIKDSMGNVLKTLSVSQTTTLELDLGVYIVEGRTDDGRTTTTTVSLSSDMPQAIATLVFPKKPTPVYVQIFPYLLIAVVAASSVVIVYRRFIRKPKPRAVK